MSESLKPVRCGCGGEAEVDCLLQPDGFYMAGCYCKNCGTKTIPFWDKEKAKAIDYAVTTWNRAMGATDMNVGDKERTVKVIEHDASITDTDGYKYHRSEYFCGDCTADALHYLKEYSSNQDTIAEQLAELKQKNDHVCEMAITVCKAYDRLCKRLAEEYRNDPLSWDELKAMEGKPVWIEAESLSVGVSPYWKGWYIISSFSDDEFMYCNDGYEWAKETQGRMWQAYRKENV